MRVVWYRENSAAPWRLWSIVQSAQDALSAVCFIRLANDAAQCKVEANSDGKVNFHDSPARQAE